MVWTRRLGAALVSVRNSFLRTHPIQDSNMRTFQWTWLCGLAARNMCVSGFGITVQCPFREMVRFECRVSLCVAPQVHMTSPGHAITQKGKTCFCSHAYPSAFCSWKRGVCEEIRFTRLAARCTVSHWSKHSRHACLFACVTDHVQGRIDALSSCSDTLRSKFSIRFKESCHATRFFVLSLIQ